MNEKQLAILVCSKSANAKDENLKHFFISTVTWNSTSQQKKGI